MFRRTSTLRRMSVAAAVAATTLAVLPAAPAAAAPPPECPFTDTLCLFEGTNFTGARFTVKSAIPPNGVCVDLVSHGWGGGRGHSAINTNSQAAQLHPVHSCYGYPLLVPGNSSLPSINFNASSVFVF
jgi:hypothetical protein